MKEFISFIVCASIGIFIGTILKDNFGVIPAIVTGLVVFGIAIYLQNKNT